MPEATSVLLGIEDEFDVIDVGRIGPGQVKIIIIEMRAVESPCPACGVITGRVKDRPLRRIKGLPASGQQTELWWRKRQAVVLGGVVSAPVVHPVQRSDPAACPVDATAP